MKYVILLFLVSNVMWSQNLDSHQWKDRIIVIEADENNSQLAESQFQLFEKEQQKLIDRKIVLYKCVANTCTFYNWVNKPKSVQTKKAIDGFSTVLIGLDGYKKYTAYKVEAAITFFNLIDTMPMRGEELKNRKKNND